MSFVDDFMDSTIESESPRSFFFWSALCAISAVVKRNVFVDRFYYKTYPNIYVLLVAKSGLRKGVPLALVKEMVEDVGNTRVIAGRSSVQAIIKELGTTRTKEKGPILSDAAGFILSSEFASSLVSDPQALTILTDLYDSNWHKEWKNLLKGTGQDVLKNVCVTMLSACNPTLFRDVITNAAISGGFIARTLIIYEEKKFRINPLTRPPIIEYKKEKLVEYLKCISQVKGRMEWSSEAMKAYEEWYKEFESVEHDDKTGTAERLQEHIVKTAILLSLADNPTLEITGPNMMDAIGACTSLTAGISKTTLGQGKSEFAHKTGVVLKELLGAKDYEMDRQKILQRNYGDIDAIDLDRVTETLLQGEMIVLEKRGGKIYYRLKKEFVPHLLNMLQRN